MSPGIIRDKKYFGNYVWSGTKNFGKLGLKFNNNFYWNFEAPKEQKSFSVILKLWKKEGKRSGIKFFENLNLDIAIFGWKKDFKILKFFSLNYENFKNILLDTTKGNR